MGDWKQGQRIAGSGRGMTWSDKAGVPGGAVRVALGAEYRREALGGLLESGSTAAPVVVPSSISRHMYAGFAELFVPLFGASNAIPGFQRLDLSLAGRHEHYSDFGNTTNRFISNYTFKMLPTPEKDLLFDKFCSHCCHVHALRFEGFAHTSFTTIDNRPDTNLWKSSYQPAFV